MLTDMTEGLGAVQHEGLADAMVMLSVFHQLHCLVCFTAAKDLPRSRPADGSATHHL